MGRHKVVYLVDFMAYLFGNDLVVHFQELLQHVVTRKPGRYHMMMSLKLLLNHRFYLTTQVLIAVVNSASAIFLVFIERDFILLCWISTSQL